MDKKDLTSLFDLPSEEQGSKEIAQEPNDKLNEQQESKSPESSESASIVLEQPAFDSGVLSDDLSESQAPPPAILEPLEGLEQSSQGLSQGSTPNASLDASMIETPELSQAQPNLDSVKKMAEKMTIGHPDIEARFPFHFRAFNKQSSNFSEQAKKRIEHVLKSENYGVRFEDVEVQLENNRLFLPRLSEFAAIDLAQKLRDVVDTIEIYPSSSSINESELEGSQDLNSDSSLIDPSIFTHQDEKISAHDLKFEPGSVSELFVTNLDQLEGFEVQKIICVLTSSMPLPSHIAENSATPAFEQACNELQENLKQKAFDLRAHGLVGLSFNLLPIDSKISENRFRLIASATAVKVSKKN